jgi:hypothetical protein
MPLQLAVHRILVAAALPALLAACAGTRVSQDATPAQLADKAVVVLSVSHDSGAAGAANAIFYLDNEDLVHRVVMKSMQDTIPGMAVKSDFADRYGHLFVLEVTPGHHTIAAWQVASGGYRLSSAHRIAPLEFDVAAGQALYLGNLHAQLVLGHKTLFGHRVASDAHPIVADRGDEDIPLAIANSPALKDRLQPALLPLGPWGDSETTGRFDSVAPVLPVKK